ncbi:hypothetical protein EDEG_02405 [Edhazardia aedis USNM 41457]|uniref:Uncharacterized protein n=1 Tax=Edhazardia aedis (strain USNM 41457) TaxID=1003232 RepID=J9DPG6_EDHAE|nr:hypothetical protein EDEG_02405 [Edhazardia aedis USNM 41457]|eukprot:EJW03237.1 hypothetical protein EDEG_02405 [Edhazardia aedis USNM 41457]
MTLKIYTLAHIMGSCRNVLYMRIDVLLRGARSFLQFPKKKYNYLYIIIHFNIQIRFIFCWQLFFFFLLLCNARKNIFSTHKLKNIKMSLEVNYHCIRKLKFLDKKNISCKNIESFKLLMQKEKKDAVIANVFV